MARSTVQKLSLEMKSRTKPKLSAHKIKHDRQDNEDKKRKGGGMYADSAEVDYLKRPSAAANQSQ